MNIHQNLSLQVLKTKNAGTYRTKKINAEAYIILPDVIAIGAMRALKENGYKIPEDIGIVGFDNINISEFTDPPLTTVNIPKYEMGRNAARLIIKMIKNETYEPKNHSIYYDLELVLRNSIKHNE